MSVLVALLLDPNPLDVWIAVRTDGVKGSGTESDPYDGSTAAKFDLIMSGVPANTTVHLGPGTFETKGFVAGGGWSIKSGQRILGSGLEVTIVKLVGASALDQHYWAMGAPLGDPVAFLNGFEASDFTVDCNMSGQPIPPGYAFAPFACGAIVAPGKHVRLRHIRAINFGTQTLGQECFVLMSGGANPAVPEVVDCVIEDCLLEKPSENNFRETSCIGMFGLGHRACVVRNCVVDCQYANGASSHDRAIKSITHVQGRQYEIETYLPHDRTTANNLKVNGVKVKIGNDWVTSSVFNGPFTIDAVTSPTDLKYTLLNDPEGDPTAGQDVWVASIGVTFIGAGVNGGTGGVTEGNRIYHTRVGIHQDTGSSRDAVFRNNYYHDVFTAIAYNMGGQETTFHSSSTLTFDQANPATLIATYTMPANEPHGLLPRSVVLISFATVNNGQAEPAYNGYFEVVSVPSAISFTYKLSVAPAGNKDADPGSAKFREFWRIRNFVVENNVIELAPSLPASRAESVGILLIGDANPATPDEYLQTVIRRNLIRQVDDISDSRSVGISLHNCESGLVEENVIHPSVPIGIWENNCARIEYFQNQTPAGLLLQGINRVTGVKIDEVATNIEDAFLLAI